ncbi:sugar phosphate isomerase/epimerase family protein [Paenibacillus alkalitolerans]|uniref:sugar phosphate isomerase/epimerase family protein n=1 Tax=Paenibacillus alkalitolerans TaxID=2799335 RepID=UPI0018F69C31|nr:sugar phosphate isomerase/epimerase family protein [Paenibacillus alkalitolerans]
MNTLGFMSYVYNGWSADAMADAGRRHGFSCVQVDPRQAFRLMDDDPLSPARAEKIRRIFEDNGITVIALSGYTNLCHPNAEKREQKLKQFEKLIDLCQAYGTKYIATETGSLHPTNSWRDWEGNRTEEAWSGLLEAVDRLRNRAVKQGVVLLIEGFANNVLARPEQALRMMGTLGTEGLAFVMDPFNYLTQDDMRNQDNAMENIFRCIEKHCPVAHAKDALYDEEGFTTPRVGEGTADWNIYASLLRSRLPDVPLILEHAKPEEVADCLTLIRKAFQHRSDG